MSKLSPIDAGKLIRILKKEGFRQVRQKGSHLRLEHSDGRKTSVPIHSGEKIGKGLLIKILKDVNIPVEKFRK
ncbi:MAG: YcfA family protein [Microgenomates group bacterium GW2011_GWC1_37_8]|uniref:YcfA family protein n=1 Tax=Candidatus Woesebacteria bacterium GW2011_GWB1_38_8 TaxID=1618570 RepID=A0A0G0L0A9_9BACT|nr:MAG: YcfA family protein [Microgenomates group bacterium GW2011_GWC1_37_8]KKQ85378.1 MAG: YcfA family protein [Candidatus Woesebacteria bacterium GW2011_GWB1_38_8]